MKVPKISTSILLTLVFVCLFLDKIGAQSDSQPNKNKTSKSVHPPQKTKNKAIDFFTQSKVKFQDRLLSAQQKDKVNQLYKMAKDIEENLKILDTNKITRQLTNIESLYKIAAKDIFTSSGHSASVRNLTTTKFLLVEISKKLEGTAKELSSYQLNLNRLRKSIDSLSLDSILFILPKDSIMLLNYEKNFKTVVEYLFPLDSLLNASIIKISNIDKRASVLRNILQFNIQLIELYQADRYSTFVKQDLPILFSGNANYKPIGEIIHASFEKAAYLCQFYFQNHFLTLVILLFIILILYYSFKHLSKKILKAQWVSSVDARHVIILNPFLSASILVLTIGQFFLGVTPFIISATIWVLLSMILLFIKPNSKTFINYRFYLLFFFLFLLVALSNIILEPSSYDVAFVFCISLFSLIISFQFIRKNKKVYNSLFLVKFTLILFVCIESITLIAISLGRYNLSKMFLVSGFNTILSSIFLYLSYKFILKALMLYSRFVNIYDNQNLFYKLKLLNETKPWIIKSIFSFIWLSLFFRNFFLSILLNDTATKLIQTERTIGKYTFTFESILTFISILFFSSILSKLISILGSSSNNYIGGPIQKKGGIGNWLLLLRLCIIMIGTILAFAATGIPMDRMTIILGSLGVGIGFGLQSIVGNLISGVILAFERPIEIGDQIELAGITGRIKEIGIRSSKMISMDGAEIIIPNNDLLSQHVINWTLSNNQRRIEIIIGVKYGTDLTKAKQILENTLISNNRIEKNPAPTALLHQFNSSSIDFRLLFWSDISDWQIIKSEIILGIDKAFREAGIEIPFPQQDIYIKQFPEKESGEPKQN